MSWAALLTMLLLAGVAALAGLVAVWAAVSKRFWFWRALGVWGCVAVLVPIRVWEPAVVFAVALPGIVGLIRGPTILRRWWASSSTRNATEDAGYRVFRFKLLDVFLVMVVVGLWLVVLRVIATAARFVIIRDEVVVPILIMAGLTGAAYWLAVGPCRVVAALTIVLQVPLGAWLMWPDVTWLYRVGALGLDRYPFPGETELYYRGLTLTGFGLLAQAAATCGYVVIVLASVNGDWRSKILRPIILATPLMIGGAGWVYWELLFYSPFPPSLEAVGRHATRIFEIGERVAYLRAEMKGDLPASAYAEPVAGALEELYDELLALLNDTNCVPFDPATNSTLAYFQETSMDRLSRLRDLALWLRIECNAAEAKGDRRRALAMACATVRLGTMLCRNGIDVDFLTGHAIFQLPNRYFAQMRGEFNTEGARQVRAVIERAEMEDEPLQRIWQRDWAFTERAYGWQQELSEICSRGGSVKETMRTVYNRWRAVNRLLETDLAIRQYRREHGAWPESLAALVPGQLEAAPVDPFSGKLLVYRFGRDDFVLYSAGKDGVDNGGRLGGSWASNRKGFDLDLDSFLRPYDATVEPQMTAVGSDTRK